MATEERFTPQTQGISERCDFHSVHSISTCRKFRLYPRHLSPIASTSFSRWVASHVTSDSDVCEIDLRMQMSFLNAVLWQTSILLPTFSAMELMIFLFFKSAKMFLGITKLRIRVREVKVYLWWSLCALYLLECHKNRRRLRSLFLCLCDVFRALVNSLVGWFCAGAVGLVLLQSLASECCMFCAHGHSIAAVRSLYQQNNEHAHNFCRFMVRFVQNRGLKVATKAEASAAILCESLCTTPSSPSVCKIYFGLVSYNLEPE